MTLKSVILTIEARAEALSTQRQDDWERARWMAAISLQPHMGKGKTIKPQDLISFPWEIRPTAAAPADKAAEEAARRELFAKWDAEMKSQWQ
jgi:hypothetical protein